MSLFWNDRYKDGRKWGMITMFQQLFWQVIDLYYPISDFHNKINLVYMVNSFICMCFFFYSYKKNVNRWVHIIPMLLLTTQQEIRMLDFENTISRYKDNKVGWHFVLVMWSCSCTMLILIIALNYNCAGATIFQFFQVAVMLYIFGLDEKQTLENW